jgi:hypothetical protein
MIFLYFYKALMKEVFTVIMLWRVGSLNFLEEMRMPLVYHGKELTH